jgi:hypothetical protein
MYGELKSRQPFRRSKFNLGSIRLALAALGLLWASYIDPLAMLGVRFCQCWLSKITARAQGFPSATYTVFQLPRPRNYLH